LDPAIKSQDDKKEGSLDDTRGSGLFKNIQMQGTRNPEE
jgi:hypothetical protein